MVNPGFVGWFKDSFFRDAGFGDLVGKNLSVLDQGDGIYLHFGVYFHGDGFGSMLHSELECCEEGCMAMSCFVCKQGTFLG